MVQPNSRLRGDDEDAILVIQVGDNGEQIGGGIEPANCRFDATACGFDERRARMKFPQNAADKSAYFSSSRVRLFVHEAERKVRIFSVSCRSAMNFVRESVFAVAMRNSGSVQRSAFCHDEF